jgi:hypothetical protein
MFITKDQARILANALNDYKFEVANKEFDKVKSRIIFNKFKCLEDYLRINGKDKRRTGRTSFDDFDDLIKRLKVNKCNGIQGIY